MHPKTCTMTMQLAVMGPYAEDFVIFAYILMDDLVVEPRILQLYKKKKNLITFFYTQLCEKMN